MDDVILARVLHVLGVVLWIGGVAFVTLVVMPLVKSAEFARVRLAQFQQIENGFATQARIWVLIAGAGGLWMVWRADMWGRFFDLHYWWMHPMAAVWAIFALMLFVVEPLGLHRRMKHSSSPAINFAKMVRVHQLLLAVSTITIFGAVGGNHRLF